MQTQTQNWWKQILPSGLFSLTFHALVLLVSAWSLRGCDRGLPVEASSDTFRDVGLAFVDDSIHDTDQPFQGEVTSPVDSTDSTSDESTETIQDSLPTEIPTLDSFPTDPNLPGESDMAELPDVIGSGRPISGLPPVTMPAPSAPERVTGQSANGVVTPGPGETAFMNVLGQGDSFVYVMDMSGSMKSGGHLNEARSQLVSSLEMLQPNQRFQILFYNDQVSELELNGKRKTKGMYTATRDKIYLARKKINSELARGGTEHFLPLLKALDLRPDVIYFLTDGETSLQRGQLMELNQRNMSAAQIHVIDLSYAPRETRDQPWLELLARQSRGVYVRRGRQ